MSQTHNRLKLLKTHEYVGVNRDRDPIRYYHWPVLGKMYRRRVEMCLDECAGGEKILEVGFGSGLSFLNLHEKYREIHGIDLEADAHAVQQAFDARGIQTHLRNGNVLDLPCENDTFDTVLLISILEHLKPQDQPRAFAEIKRVLKPGGQVVYGVPIERPLMVFMFHMLGFDIRQHHFSTEKDVAQAAAQSLQTVCIRQMKSTPSIFGSVYEVGHFVKPWSGAPEPK